jgi:hypothetical protein
MDCVLASFALKQPRPSRSDIVDDACAGFRLASVEIGFVRAEFITALAGFQGFTTEGPEEGRRESRASQRAYFLCSASSESSVVSFFMPLDAITCAAIRSPSLRGSLGHVCGGG